MRVAQIAPLAESVPPKLYGGTERVVSWLADELVALGHEVTLFASGDSRTKAKLVPAWPRALRLGRPRADPAAAYATLLEAVAEAAADFDVIHSHVDWLPLPLLRRLQTPFLTTLHGRLDFPTCPWQCRPLAMRRSSRSHKASAYRFRALTGWRPFITGCPRTCSRSPGSRKATWPFWAGSRRRRVRTSRSEWPVPRVWH